MASFLSKLTLIILESIEDLCLSKIAEKLDVEDAKTLSHEDAWTSSEHKTI